MRPLHLIVFCAVTLASFACSKSATDKRVLGLRLKPGVRREYRRRIYFSSKTEPSMEQVGYVTAEVAENNPGGWKIVETVHSPIREYEGGRLMWSTPLGGPLDTSPVSTWVGPSGLLGMEKGTQWDRHSALPSAHIPQYPDTAIAVGDSWEARRTNVTAAGDQSVEGERPSCKWKLVGFEDCAAEHCARLEADFTSEIPMSGTSKTISTRGRAVALVGVDDGWPRAVTSMRERWFDGELRGENMHTRDVFAFELTAERVPPIALSIPPRQETIEPESREKFGLRLALPLGGKQRGSTRMSWRTRKTRDGATVKEDSYDQLFVFLLTVAKIYPDGTADVHESQEKLAASRDGGKTWLQLPLVPNPFAAIPGRTHIQPNGVVVGYDVGVEVPEYEMARISSGIASHLGFLPDHAVGAGESWTSSAKFVPSSFQYDPLWKVVRARHVLTRVERCGERRCGWIESTYELEKIGDLHEKPHPEWTGTGKVHTRAYVDMASAWPLTFEGEQESRVDAVEDGHKLVTVDTFKLSYERR